MHKKISTILSFLIFLSLTLVLNTAHAQSTDEQYRQAIESADNYFSNADYLNAKASYQVASQLKPSEQYPRDRLKESISRLRVQMEQMAIYNEKLSDADKLYENQSYGQAIITYLEAQKLMPSDQYPADQIELIKKIQLEEAQKEARYNKLIEEGDALFAAENYNEARAKYQAASDLYGERKDAKEKAKAADQKLLELVAQQSGYEKAISEAEMFHARKDYENELKAYETASELKPEEAWPQIKIRELNEFLRKYESYNKFVSEADELYVSQQFAEAKLKYERALEVLPDESYPKEIISKINIALSEKTERDKVAYEEAIARADELFNQEDYDAAMIAYSDALRFWPEGEHAKAMLNSIDDIRTLQQAQEEAYNNFISHADKLFADKDYTIARGEYRKAADIKPFEQYPKVRMDEIDMILAEIQSQLDQYEKIIVGADRLFHVGDYEEARIQYLKAQEILSDRTYPEDQIRMIDDILGLEKAIRDDYLAAIARGDEHFARREWEDAKVDYVTANDLIPEEQYPDDKIAEINEILARLKAELENYTLTLKTADQLFAEQDYSGALREYEKAAEIFEDEAYPRQQIEEINRILNELKAVDDNYSEAIAQADQHFSNQRYDEAMDNYRRAAGIKPEESYPNERIAEIEDIYADIAAAEAERLAKLEADYLQAINDADAAMEVEGYFKAKESYQVALQLKADEPYPQEQIAQIDGILGDIEAQRILDEGYADVISDADKLFNKEDYNQARIEYEKAAIMKEEEQHPKDRIAAIDAIFAERQALEDAYETTIANADLLMEENKYHEARTGYEAALNIKPNEKYPEDQIAAIAAILDAEAAETQRLAKLEADYAALISEADAAFAEEDYTLARKKYNEALGLKSDKQYPQDKIVEIDSILSGIETQRLLDENYAGAIAEADRLFNKEDYVAARAEYEKARDLKAEEQYPIDKIAEIEAFLAEQVRLQGIEESYTASISLADQYLNNQQYAEARAEYNNAANIKPEETYPKDKIQEIEAILEEIARQQSILEADYMDAITAADAAFEARDYPAALEKYQLAVSLKANESYPQTRIDAIFVEQARLEDIDERYTEVIALAVEYFDNEQFEEAKAEYKRADEIKPGETLPGERISEIDAILAEISRVNAAYQVAIETADNHFADKQYEDARISYVRAQGIKDEAYPEQQIKQIDLILSELEEYRLIEEGYANAIAHGENYMVNKEYVAAKAEFEKALTIKPEEQHPQVMIAQIEAIFEEEARKQELEASYNKVIAEADEHFATEDYEQALKEYREALSYKPLDEYASDKITETDKIINDAILAEIAKQNALNEQYSKAIADADDFLSRNKYLEALQSYEKALEIKAEEKYPRDKINEINARLSELKEERLETYNAAIAQADSYYDMGNYRSAKSSYQTAVDIKSDEQYARDRLDEVTRLYMAEIEALKVDYRKYIADADNYFNGKIYDGAIENYRLAAALLPDEEYPGKMISRITKIINDNAITDVNRLSQIIPDGTEKNFSFTSLPVSVRKENYILIKARNLSDTEFKMLVNFGRDNSKTGGIVLQVPRGEDIKDYIIRIGAVYKWFSEDNNWLSIYPEGGDLEVALIRISKSD